MKLRYRNTRFARQLFFYFKGRYCGVEIGKRYIRYYRITEQGALGKYKELHL